MTFELPALLWLLFLLPLAAAALLYWERQRRRRRSEYADPALLGAALQGAPSTRWLSALQLTALGLLLLGAAQPEAQLKLPSNQAAVMIALDTSRSMLADDVQPTRLAAAEAVIRQFLQLAPASTRIGFLTFSDRAAVMVPPTTDRRELLDALERVKPAQATSLSGALVSAVRALPGRETAAPPPELMDTPTPASPPVASPPPLTGPFPPGAVLLLSDGISNRGGSPLIARPFRADARGQGVHRGAGQGRRGPSARSAGRRCSCRLTARASGSSLSSPTARCSTPRSRTRSGSSPVIWAPRFAGPPPIWYSAPRWPGWPPCC